MRFASVTLAAAVIALAAPVNAADAPKAYADIKGCEDAKVTGRATLTERPSAEGVKLVDIEIKVSGLPDGKKAVHIHEVANCTPCGAAKGHFTRVRTATAVPTATTRSTWAT